MSKPTFAQFLLVLSSPQNPQQIIEAVYYLNGVIGAGLDERDWTSILASNDPLAAAKSGFLAMYSDPAFLLRNANHLQAAGYSPNQIALTYKQFSSDFDFQLPTEWAVGTVFEAAISGKVEQNLSASIEETNAVLAAIAEQERLRQLQEELEEAFLNSPIPGLTLSNDFFGFKVEADQGGRLLFSDGTFIANLTAGVQTLLEELAALTSGTIKLQSALGKSSPSTTQVYTLGTVGNDAYDSSGNGAQVDYIDTGAGDDVITGGGGADIIYAGAGDDTIRGDDGDVRLDGGDGNDTLEVDANFAPNLGLVNRIEEITAIANGLTINLTGTFFQGVINSFAAGATTITSSNGDDTMNGGAGNDIFNGNSGDNTFTGNGGNDTYNSGIGTETYNVNAGSDTISRLRGSSVFVVSAGADLVATVGGNFTATAASQNLGGANTDAVFNIDVLNATSVNFSAMTIATATTDGITINATGRALANVSFTGSNGDDVINSSNPILATSMTLNGADGDDDINGAAGRDIINGGNGDDSISGGADNDTLTGGAGADELTGDDGDDDFVFSTAATNGADTITDFTSTEDDLDLQALTLEQGADAQTDLLTAADGGGEAIVVTTAFATGQANADALGVIVVTDEAAPDWSDVTAVIEFALIVGGTAADNSTVAIIVDNGTDTRLYNYTDVNDGFAAADDLTLLATISGIETAGFVAADFIA